ncbi:MAG TPA: NAD(P)/FAD-dependent oxidoreductase [Acholeplasma sp.]|nr:NAD(P)/FAD-dependent oxidoreductase [Acholeplasma sp.]
MYDTIIIGSGPAGITAAIYLKRSNKNVLVIGKPGGAMAHPSTIDNYYGFPGGITGAELQDLGIKQAREIGIEVLTDEVIAIDKLTDFTIITNKNTYEAKTVLLATGKSRQTLKIKGFNQYKGKGISFCVTCDGFFFRQKKLALVGFNEYMLHELKDMEFLTDDITIFTNGHELTVEVDYPVVTDPILEILGDEYGVNKIATEKNHFDTQGIFVAIGTPSAADFATRIGAVVESGNILVDNNHQTNVEGLFAAGDTIGGVLQIVKASNDGMLASNAIKKHLRK